MGNAQDAAFRQLNVVLSLEPVLWLPDWNKHFIVRTGASDIGLGAVLLQEHEDRIFPVLYLSRKLNKAERNYSVGERMFGDCVGHWKTAAVSVRTSIRAADRSSPTLVSFLIGKYLAKLRAKT